MIDPALIAIGYALPWILVGIFLYLLLLVSRR
jgi:hypothetical protein